MVTLLQIIRALLASPEGSSPIQAEVARIAAATDDHSAAGIAAAVNRLIKSGELAAGSRLPTVRALASALGISPTTVNEAWRSLVRIGSVRTHGRNGSFVTDGLHAGWPSRFWRIAGTAGEFAIDLSAGVPDPALLPPLPELTPGGRRGPGLSGYLDPPVLPQLERMIRSAWREVHEPERVTVVDGSLDAVDRVLTSVLRLGDRVLVENPTFPPFLDMLELIGAQPVAVGIDSEGMRPDALRDALASNQPTVLLLQPRAHNPTGASMSRARAADLAAVLRADAPSTIVVEDDHAGPVAAAEPVSLAAHLPERTVSIMSFSKAYGPDLRLAAIGGPDELIEPVIARRNLGPAWSSRLLQQLLADMLSDSRCTAAIDTARTVYAQRRQALVDALAERGIEVLAGDGFNLWLPVAGERDALVVLATQGIGAAPGRPFLAAPLDSDYLRITTAGLSVSDAGSIADALASAARNRPHALRR
ncbi:aminotransferase class I/II-fold pyridoxal phosphate-dependent enzyme [Pseudonocardia spinosispora]|uniref:aminotransferase class I/II-fold pyridoxal phosphate-dependent enzyme n=1 Tax=Pseudonocardia spinosispora TaxID=103441 RepID=UPI00041ADD36|nr:aminotransferase class I/II-fold pyridoxal phosphate-dependent enzyme [Pseudonocardia spinosispora]